MANLKDLIRIVDENRIVEVESKDKFRQYLNQAPAKSWIKEHPFAKDVDYLPIDKVEALLDAIFQDWKVEIKGVAQIAQSICVTVRLHYRHPLTGEWLFHDGVGATPLKTDKGYSAADLAHIKSDAVATGAPAAKAFAIKDAADHIGKIFGRDLNRKDTISLKGVYKSVEDVEENPVAKAVEALKSCNTLEELKKVFVGLDIKIRGQKEVVEAKDAMKLEIIKLEKANESLKNRAK